MVDYVYQLFEPVEDERTFSSIVNFKRSYQSWEFREHNKESYFLIECNFSSAHIVYTRTVYGILDAIGDIGGLNDAVYLALHFFVSFFVSKSYEFDAVSKSLKRRKTKTERIRMPRGPPNEA